VRLFDRYVLHEELASGGMAAVHLGQMLGDAGFRRTVAIKRMHPHLVASADARAMFLDEARISARIRHRNVVATLDVVEHERELFLVMEYVHGVALSVLSLRAREAKEGVPIAVAARVVLDVLEGLEAAHQAADESGKSLGIVHRDVSPQNVMVGKDGMAQVLDFGIAKAAVRLQTTREGQIKGKLRYMGPEQFLEEDADVRTDVYAVAVTLWELLTGLRLFDGMSEGAIVAKVLEGVVAPPSRAKPGISGALDALVMRGLSRERAERFGSCREMAGALRAAVTAAPAAEVAAFVERLAGDLLRERAARVAAMEAGVAVAAAAPIVEPSEGLTATVVEMPAPKRERRWWWLALPAVAAAGVAAIAIPRKTPPAVEPAPAVTVAEATPAPEPEATNEPVPTPPASQALPARKPAAPHRRSGTHSEARPHPGRGKANCDPMFTVDANGIQRVKSECL